MALQARDAQERKRHGRHYTPPELARFLARRALRYVPRAGVLRVLDPACGDGELLLAVHREISSSAPDLEVQLVGFDLDRRAVDETSTRAAAVGVEIDCRAVDFLTASDGLADGSFDLIISNPPYVRTQQLGGATAQLLSKQFGLRGRIDLTHPFVAIAPRLLTPGGVLGLLCANRFLTTRAGANLRRILTSELTPVELYDLGDTKLFAAAVLPAITVALRANGPPNCRYVSVYEELGVEPDCGTGLFDALAGEDGCRVGAGGRVFAVEVGVLVTGEVTPTVTAGSDTAWRMSRPAIDHWLGRIADRTWRSFGEVGRIRVGIKTTADRVFISDQWDQKDPSPEPELLRELITHHDLQPWQVAMSRGTKVLYPYDLLQPRRTPIDLAEYPCAAEYLRSHEQVLSGRRYVLDGGRKWFEIWVPQRPHLWRAPKLVFPDISERPRFALDRSGAVVNGDCYWISLTDLGDAPTDLAYLLMGVANSTLGLKFYDAVCGNRLYSGRRRWITQYVARLPLPDPACPAACEIVRRVRALLEDGVPVADSCIDEVVAAAFGVSADADHG
ncbi:Eco57I restriction-modification methylase domain-containing protein [Nocardia sp. NPDC058666]|uniref:Eco57I restriction-modification methylase domain-containing protein n=1 Tax=Nocardia sp. NPDC058666 TaxID=3346587 RepID=UPI0036590E74